MFYGRFGPKTKIVCTENTKFRKSTQNYTQPLIHKNLGWISRLLNKFQIAIWNPHGIHQSFNLWPQLKSIIFSQFFDTKNKKKKKKEKAFFQG